MKKSHTLLSIPGLMAMGAILMGAVAVTSCGSSRSGAQQSSVVPPAQDYGPDGFGAYRNLPGPAALPNARIYRTSTDVDKYVPVTVNPVDGRIMSYPAPTDITGASMPVVLKDGWLLDRRGISPDTRFVRYTYSEYHDLSEAPSTAQLLEAIIPDARVTEIVELPYKTGSITPAQADSIIADGLKRCEVVFSLSQSMK